MTDIAGPASHSYFSQRLRLHYVDWGNESAPPLLLVHGGRDHCRNWDWVARALRAQYHVIAPDLRGHGNSQWVKGSSYQMLDYVYDIGQLIQQKRLTPLVIVSHSLGASVSLHYTGLYPERVSKLVAIEGLGPPPAMLEERARMKLHERLLDWVDTTRTLSARQPRRYPDLESTFRRMQEENPHLSEEQARHLTIHGVNQNEDGTYSWKFDNYVRSMSPAGLSAEDMKTIMGRITCPTLLVRGTESWASDPCEDGWLKVFQNARSVNVEKAGHWVHHDQLDIFLDLVRNHLQQ